MIQIRILTEKELPHVTQLSNKIFDPILQGLNKNEDPSIWQENYKKDSLVIGAYSDKQIVGFIFFYEKFPGTKNIQCWMCGVDEKCRGQGILTTLMQVGMKKLKEREYEYVTVSTYPEKFPMMFSFLQKYHFEQYKEEDKQWHEEVTKKAFFRKKL